MTAAEFRRIALSFPDATESAHMGHPDFRLGGRIFATLGPKEAWGMVKLTPGEQEWFMSVAPAAFRPAAGAWGKQGSTIVELKDAKKATVREAMAVAFRNAGKKKKAK
jgi:hypothetical protein